MMRTFIKVMILIQFNYEHGILIMMNTHGANDIAPCLCSFFSSKKAHYAVNNTTQCAFFMFSSNYHYLVIFTKIELTKIEASPPMLALIIC